MQTVRLDVFVRQLVQEFEARKETIAFLSGFDWNRLTTEQLVKVLEILNAPAE